MTLWLQALGAQEMQWDQALDKRPWQQMYTVPGNCIPLGWQTTEGGPGRTSEKLDVVASFCCLADMLSAAGGCELFQPQHVWNRLEEVQDLLPVLSSCHLSFKTRGRVYSSCVGSAMLHASETWPLTKPNLQRLQWNDRAMIKQICSVRPQDIVTTRSNELLVQLGIVDLDLILKERRLWWYGHVEPVWNAPMVQSRQPLTYRLMESVGLGSPKWHGSSWQRGIAESGGSRLSALMINISGDLVWDLPCVQQASYLEGGPLMWMLPLYLQVNQKSDYDMMICYLCDDDTLFHWFLSENRNPKWPYLGLIYCHCCFFFQILLIYIYLLVPEF